MKVMKIAFVINKATHTSIPLEMANILSRTHELTVLSLYNSQKQVDEVCGVVAPSCRCLGFSFSRDRLGGMKKFKNELQSGEYDLVHTHHTFSGSLARFLLRNQTKTKTVHTVHANHHSFSFMQNLVIGSTLGLCDCVVFNSNSSRNGLMEWQKKIIRKVPQKTIYNGIDVKRIQNANSNIALEFCRRNGISENTFLFAQVGRLEPVKNPIQSIKAFSELIKAIPSDNLKFVFIGDGSQREKIEEFIREHDGLGDKVILTGTIKRDEVYGLLQRINTLVVPSLYEGFCNALFEGLSAGVPIIASDIDVFRELIQEDLGVKKFNPASTEELTVAMKASAERKPTLSEKEKWKKEAYEKFDIRECANNYIRLYEELLAGG